MSGEKLWGARALLKQSFLRPSSGRADRGSADLLLRGASSCWPSRVCGRSCWTGTTPSVTSTSAVTHPVRSAQMTTAETDVKLMDCSIRRKGHVHRRENETEVSTEQLMVCILLWGSW
eukprot:4093098-Pleurochrysis_carterae.AAC.2